MDDEDVFHWMRAAFAPSRAQQPKYASIRLDEACGLEGISSLADGPLGAALLTELALSLKKDVVRERQKYKRLIVNALRRLRAPLLDHSPEVISVALHRRTLSLDTPPHCWRRRLGELVDAVALPADVIAVVRSFLGDDGWLHVTSIPCLSNDLKAFSIELPAALERRLRACWGSAHRVTHRVLGDEAEVQAQWSSTPRVLWLRATDAPALLGVLRALKGRGSFLVTVHGLGEVLV
jgi:hypothetical protein